MPNQHCELRLPDFGMDDVPATVCCWLVHQGSRVVEGDRLVEILAGEVTVDLSAPATGRFIRCQVAEDEPVAKGQVLGVIRVDPE